VAKISGPITDVAAKRAESRLILLCWATDAFTKGIVDLCERHRKENRALAFAFLMYDFQNPQIFKILEDINYWNALNTISGEYLSVYYIHSPENTFGQDLSLHNAVEHRWLYPIDHRMQLNRVTAMLRNYLAFDEHVRLPVILFFQVEGNLICDYFLIELFEDKMEESFLELKEYLSSAVNRLKMIAPENYGNVQAIFESMKHGVKHTKFRRILFKSVQKFPVQLLLSWIIGKV